MSAVPGWPAGRAPRRGPPPPGATGRRVTGRVPPPRPLPPRSPASRAHTVGSHTAGSRAAGAAPAPPGQSASTNRRANSSPRVTAASASSIGVTRLSLKTMYVTSAAVPPVSGCGSMPRASAVA